MDIIQYTNIKDITLEEFIINFKISKKNVYKLFQNKFIKVNNQIANPSYKLCNDDVITINIEDFEGNKILPWDFKIDILYEDEDILIINKPSGILVHTDGKCQSTLANAVSFYYYQKKIDRQIRHVHRLDYDTSGVIVYAKHFLAHSYLNYQIEQKLFNKKYYAVISGCMERREGVINLNIGRDRHNSNKYIVTKSGKESITKYRTITCKKTKSLIEIELETGRTHQIRVHFSHLHHPLIGDKIYGKEDKRLMLHSYEVSFYHPRTFKRVTFNAKIPKDFLR